MMLFNYYTARENKETQNRGRGGGAKITVSEIVERPLLPVYTCV